VLRSDDGGGQGFEDAEYLNRLFGAERGAEVLLDAPEMDGRRTTQRPATRRCEGNDKAAAIRSVAGALDQAFSAHAVDKAGEPAFAEQDGLCQIGHPQTHGGRLGKLQEHVVAGETEARRGTQLLFEGVGNAAMGREECPPRRQRVCCRSFGHR
jgi:hypothetical protein